MDKERKEKDLRVLEALADGVDPLTGEVFPTDSPYQHPNVVRALFRAAEAVRKEKEKPPRQGSAWDPEEDERLMKGFREGKKPHELAKAHQRSKGAVRSRLVKLGAIEK